MKQLQLLLPTLFLTISLFSQDLKNVNFGLEINPKMVTQIFDNNKLAESSSWIGAAVAGNIYLNFSPRHSIKTGLSFNLIKIEQLDYSLTFGCDFDGSMVVFGNSFSSVNYSIYYLGIPLENKLNLTNKKNHPYLKVGGEVLFNIGTTGKHQIHECGTNILEPSNSAAVFPFLLLLDVGIGYELTLKNERKFYIEPQVEYSVSRVFRKSTLLNNSRLLNIGLVVGMQFK